MHRRTVQSDTPRLHTSVRMLVLALVLALSLVAAACGGSEEEVVETTTTDQEVTEGTMSEPSSDNGSAADGDVELPSGFPSGMPLPAGVESVRDDVASGGYSAFVPGRGLAEVVADVEAALDSSGWNILERTADIGTVGDMLFLVEESGAKMYVFVEPSGGSEEDMRVLYYAAD